MKKPAAPWAIIGLLALGWCAFLATTGLGPARVTGLPATGSLPDQSTTAAGQGTITLGPEVVLAVEQQELLRCYMDAYFRSLAGLVMEYPDELFAAETAPQTIGDMAVWEITIEVRKMQAVDLRLASYAYNLLCDSVTEQETGDIVVHLTESNVQRFMAYPGIDSESRGISHRFTLAEVDGAWYIKQHRGGGTVSHLVMRSYGHSTNVDMLDVMESVPATKDLIIADARANVRQRAAQPRAILGSALLAGQPYDREAAIAYAAQWSLERNPRWPVYDEYGGNCVNFTSQCLLAGGIPMDNTGQNQWKWYGETHNTSQTASGRSASWASVDEFYKYAAANTGGGLVAEVDADYYTGEPGDILQLGFLQDWRHGVLITEVVKDENGQVIDYLISSNTTDQRNFPASAYLYTMQRLIKIHGWTSQ